MKYEKTRLIKIELQKILEKIYTNMENLKQIQYI